MGLQLEITSGRTLTIRGTKKVVRRVQRVNATTHSYTIHTTLNASGFIPQKLPVVLFERTGVPQYFQTEIEKHDNLVVYWSTSGWMGTEIAKKWMKDVFLPMVESNSILIIDSWNGFNEMKKMPELVAKNLQIETLPPGSTATLQPADVYYNRTFKNFIRLVSNKIRWRHNDFILSVRSNLLTLIDLTHNQFKAARYRPFLLYSWYRAGYFPEHPPEFLTPVQFCLQFRGYTKCERDNCNTGYCFMRCSYCELHLCFAHIIHHRH